MRALVLVPRVGNCRSRQIGVFSGPLPIVCIAYLLVPWIRARSRQSLVLVGFFCFVLTVLFGIGFGHYAFRRSWMSLARRDFDIPHRGLLPIGLAVLAFSPLIATRSRGIKAGAAE